MDALMGFLGTVRQVAWWYLIGMSLAATWLAVFHANPRIEDEAEKSEPFSERRAA